MKSLPTMVSRVTRGMPLAAILAFLVTRAILLSHNHFETDIHFYHEYFLRAAAGEVPYRDIAIAYPPVAWWVMALPNTTDWPTYRDRFRRAMVVPDVAAFALFTLILLRRRPACARWGCTTYVVTTAVLEHLLYDRLDVGLLFLLMLWAYAWLRAEERTAKSDLIPKSACVDVAPLTWRRTSVLPLAARAGLKTCATRQHKRLSGLGIGPPGVIAERGTRGPAKPDRGIGAPGVTRDRGWGIVAYLALGVGVAYKLVPAVMLPFVLLAEVTKLRLNPSSRNDVLAGGESSLLARRASRRPWRSLLVRSTGFAIGLTSSFLVHYPSAGLATLDFLKYHLGRGIQIESAYAVLLWIMSGFGVPLAVANLPDTVEVVSPAVPIMVRLSNMLSVGFVGALGVRALWLGHRFDGRKAYAYSLLALAGLILFAKGLSPQYFIWIIPVLMLCGAEVLSARRFVLLCAQLTVLSVMTTVVFPRGFRALLALDPRILWVLAARDLLFAAIVFWMAAQLLRRERPDPAAS